MASEPRVVRTGVTNRLYALRSYEVLGTAPEAGFDRLVGLAARLLNAPIAFVSLVDEDRQWYKACFGMDLEETPHSFCARAIEQDDLLVVQDAVLDARFAGDPLVMDAPHIRFYAGAPLVVEGGMALGTLCIIDTVPRPDLTAEERHLLKDLAASVVSELELHRVVLAQRRSEVVRQAMLDTALDSVITMNQEGRVTEWNRAAEQMFGWTGDEALGQDLSELVVPDVHRAAHRIGLTHYLATGEGPVLGRRIELSALRKDGSEFPVELAITAFKVGAEMMFTAYVRDIRDRKQAEHLLQNYNQELESRVQQRTRALEDTQFEMLDRLARAAEHRDDETGEHVRRVASMAAALAHDLGLCPEDVELLRRAAPLHDVGKIGVPDGILLKPGPLTKEEFQIIRTHTTIGGNILSGGNSRLVQAAQEVALTHHERWDGTGYPRGLRAEEIPLFGRIVAVADVYDALTSTRPYKLAWGTAEALNEISSQAGSQFDPQVIISLHRILAAPVSSSHDVTGGPAPHLPGD